MSTLVAPFYRASVEIGPAERELFARELPVDRLAAGLAHASPILRQNLRRLFAAAFLAHSLGGRLVFVEGFRSNRVARRGRSRFVTGSWVLAVAYRALRRRGLVPASGAPLRFDRSRCTAEEAHALVTVARSFAKPMRIVGVADSPCPSPVRAQRYLRALDPGAMVVSPRDALGAAGTPVATLSVAQAAFWRAVQPRRLESALAGLVEAPNWGVHALPLSLEIALAHRLRADRR